MDILRNSTQPDENQDTSNSNIRNTDLSLSCELDKDIFASAPSTEQICSSSSDSGDCKKIKCRAWKNVLVLAFSWLLLYMGLTPMASVQSSLNANDGLGTFSLSIAEGSRMLGTIFFSTILVDRFDVKWLIFVGQLLTSVFMLANFYPVWETMLPCAGLYGFGKFLMWMGESMYLSKLAEFYSQHVNTPIRTVNVRTFGTFYGIYYCNHVLGNVIASLILGAGSASSSQSMTNFTLYDPMELCGAQFCNEDMGMGQSEQSSLHVIHSATFWNGSGSQEVLQDARNWTTSLPASTVSRRPDAIRLYALCGFCFGFCLLGALLVLFFLDTFKDLGIEQKSSDSQKTTLQLLGDTIRLWRNPKLLPLLPLFIYNGFDDSFIGTELSKAFVTCAIGVEYVGLVSTLFGIMCPISAALCGWFVTPKTRFLPFLLLGAAHLSSLFGMFLWKASSPVLYLYVMSAVWGIGSGVVGSQTNALCSIVFPDHLEAAFSNFWLFNAGGAVVFFGLSSVLCTYVKLYLVGGVVTMSIVGVALVEMITCLERRKQTS